MSVWWIQTLSASLLSVLGLFSLPAKAPEPSSAQRRPAGSERTTPCPGYKKETSVYPLGSHNPAAKNFDGLTLPATGKTLYRGIYLSNGQYSLEKILRGLVGEKVVVGSPMHWGITDVLRGNKTLKDTLLPGTSLVLPLETYFEDRNILADVQSLLDCAAGEPFSEALSDEYANDLMEKSFKRRSDSDNDKYFFNLKDGHYYGSYADQHGFGNNAVDFVISSYYDSIAGIYGPKILVFKEPKNRSVDLCYWNYVQNGIYCDNWVDSGEVDTLGYVESEDFLGYQARRTDRLRVGWGAALTPNPIEVAYYRIDYKGQRAVLVLDGEGRPCITKGSDDHYYYCEMETTVGATGTVGKTPDMRITKYRVPLMGVIAKNAALSKEINTWYNRGSKKRPNGELMNALNAIDGVKFYSNDVPGIEYFEGIKVVSAKYTDAAGTVTDITRNVARAMNGRNAFEYMLAKRFLEDEKLVPDTDPATTASLELVYKCGSDPAKQVAKTITPAAERTKFTITCE